MTDALRVLVLDDERIVCDRLRPALEKSGFEVETRTDSREAIDLLRERRFDVLITDLKMRGPDGMDVLALVREQFPETRCVVITGFATVATAKEALRLGAVDFIAKPFRMRQLVDLVRRMADEILAQRGEGAAPPSS